MTLYPLAALRALALHATKLDIPNGSEPLPSPDSVFETVDRLGAVQIDTIQMVARAHFITLWSRHWAYDQSNFDMIAYHAEERQVIQSLHHAARFISPHA